MHTIHSILVAGAIFGSFMLLGMENAAGNALEALEGNATEASAPHGKDKTEGDVVLDNKKIRLMLLYHNPSRGLPAKSCRAPQHPAHAETGGTRGDAA